LLGAVGAEAHTRGLSRSTFEIAADGTVRGRLQLATADLPATATESDVALAELAVRGVDVRADGASCPGRFVGSRADGADGVELDVDFACAKDASVVEVELFLLSGLSEPRASSQSVISLVAGPRTKQAVLDAAHRSVQMEIAPRKPARSAEAWWIGAGAAVAIALGILAALRHHRRR